MYSQLPEVEDVTMHLARLANIKTVFHCLIRLQSGNLVQHPEKVTWPENHRL
jgi:serine/threonine-protein kinase HipA